MPDLDNKFVPLSVRTGNRRTRAAWKWKGVKERVALWLCPWLTGAAERVAAIEDGRGDWRTVNVRGRVVTLAIGGELDECGQFRVALMVDRKELCRFHVTDKSEDA